MSKIQYTNVIFPFPLIASNSGHFGHVTLVTYGALIVRGEVMSKVPRLNLLGWIYLPHNTNFQFLNMNNQLKHS